MKIRDPRDRRRFLTLIDQKNMLGKDATAWESKSGEISVYRSTDSPRQEIWIHGLNDANYKDYITYTS